MLRQLDLSNLGQSVVTILTSVVIVLIALTCHEAAHGLAAMKLGDQTAKLSGRLSLNPLAHLDPIGFLCMLLFGFGWARPVPVDARNFRKPKRDMALTALAGPISNLLLAFVILIPYALLVKLLGSGAIAVRSEFQYNLIVAFIRFVYMFHYMNLTLAIFNFIPVPPLDGSRVLYAVLPDKYYFGVMKYERYISLALMLLLMFGILDRPLSAASQFISNRMQSLIGLIIH